MGKLPVFLENQTRGNYKVYLDAADSGCDACMFLNQTYDADPEIAKWLQNRDFRIALSLGINRDQLNEAFWLGAGDSWFTGAGGVVTIQPWARVPYDALDARPGEGQPTSRQHRTHQERR
jgi:ABC-type transport system substrate-binding protein